MKQILSFILVSALVFSATANVEVISEVMTGFTLGLNYGDLNAALANCSTSANNTKTSALTAAAASELKDQETFEQSVALFGYNFAHTIRVCGNAKLAFAELYESLSTQLKTLTREDLSNRLLANLFTFNTKWIQLKGELSTQSYRAVGGTLAEMFKIFVYSNTTIPTTRRQLGEIADQIRTRVGLEVNSTVLGVLGFIEEGNTTIAVEDYLNLVNDTTLLATQFTTLEDAISKFDFTTIVSTVMSISKNLVIVGADATIIKNQTVAFVNRDLPLFTDEAKVTKAVEALFLHLPTTISNVMRISAAYKNADYRETGRGTGAFYNQLRNGALGL